MEKLPMIFQTDMLTYEQRLKTYSEMIPENCKISEVTIKLAEYVEKFVCKRGWKAIWSCTDLTTENDLNILVEVVNIVSRIFSAEVNVCVPLVTNPPILYPEAQALLRERDNRIPLTELSPVYDESGDFDETAMAMEHVRFFFENIWREWDSDANEDYLYAEKHLESRLRLYYDISLRNLPEDFITKYNECLNDYKQANLELKRLRQKMFASDSEEELDSSEVLALAEKTHRSEEIARVLQIMEDPQVRDLLLPFERKELTETKRHYPTMMFVAEKLTAKMTKSLPDEAVIEHYTSLERAIENSCSHDTLVVCSGHYSVGPLVFGSLRTMIGDGEVKIECTEESEPFLTTFSPSIKFNNIKFHRARSSSFILVVEKGKTELKNCELRSSSADGIVVKQGAKLTMENCKVHGVLNTCVTIEENSEVLIRRCIIHSDNMRGNSVAIKIFSNEARPPKVEVAETRISGCFNHGIVIVDGQKTKTVQQHNECGVGLTLKNNACTWV